MTPEYFSRALDRAVVEVRLCWVHIRVGTCTKEFKSFAYAFLRVHFAGMSRAYCFAKLRRVELPICFRCGCISITACRD